MAATRPKHRVKTVSRSPVARQFKPLLNLGAVFEITRKLRAHSQRVVLFGSYAEVTDGPASYIDIFILTRESQKVREIARGCSDNQGTKMSLTIINSNEFQQLKAKYRPPYKRISRGITLWDAGQPVPH